MQGTVVPPFGNAESHKLCILKFTHCAFFCRFNAIQKCKISFNQQKTCHILTATTIYFLQAKFLQISLFSPFFLKLIPLFDIHNRIFIQVSPLFKCLSYSNLVNFQEDKNYGKINFLVCSGNSESRFSFLLQFLQRKSVPAEQYRFFRFHNSIKTRYAFLHSTNFLQQTYWDHIERRRYCTVVRFFTVSQPVKSRTFCRP